MTKSRLGMLCGIILAAAMTRLIPHPPNMTPMVAVALFGGAQFSGKKSAFLITFGALLLSDFFIGFHSQMFLVYLSFAFIVLIGSLLRERKNALSILGAGIASSVLFFIVTNFGVWIFTNMYPKTSAGFIACYVAAIPFFRNALTGDILYTLSMFGFCALVEKRFPLFQEKILQQTS